MLGDSANALVTDSNRSIQTRTLLPYSANTLRDIIRECHSLSSELIKAAETYANQSQLDESTDAEITLSALALNRNRRSVLIYHQQRLDTLKEIFWNKGGILSNAFGLETDTRKNMAPVDVSFAKNYSDLCLEFKTSWYGNRGSKSDPAVQLMDATDLLGGGTESEPPKDLYVSVRVLKDVGEIETMSGSRMSLTKGSQYYLAREEVENMVVMGLLEITE